ncbi:nucleotidyltransferase family protein [Alkalinema pantanalense CENA528]|uniref:nucleotidyltransferase family protein n=1 Tax=Alkalinema pantanalense TaxID=1620705 RepID=UPI003D702252
MEQVALAQVALTASVDEILRERLGVDRSTIARLCERFGIVEMGLFGSVLREDFRVAGDAPSDVDVLVEFGPEHRVTWQSWQELNGALSELFGRRVDVVQKRLLENPYRRSNILKTHRVIYG